MRNLAIVGAQWGDEGKGKIVDFFSSKFDAIVRWAGGDNAGHSIEFNNKRYKLSIIPSGIFNEKALNIIATGCVVNLEKINEEINYLKSFGFSVNNLRISDKCTVIFDYHLKMDGIQEVNRKEGIIGTTKRGIGPAYIDSYDRCAIKVYDLFNKEVFFKKLKSQVEAKNRIIKEIYNSETLDFELIYQKNLDLFEKIKSLVCDTSILVSELKKQSKSIMFEGAQGVMLDIYHGTYPYVTSSHPIATSIPADVGCSLDTVQNIIGVVKAYSTRVGKGGFPSEIFGETENYIREKGREYGTVTGRPRRVGWLDVVAIKHAIRISDLRSIAVTLLDVLGGIKEINICVKYLLDGKEIDYVPSDIEIFNKCKPVLVKLPGWDEDISKITDISQLPKNALNYIKKIEELCGINVSIFSFGPDRKQTIILNEKAI